MGAHGVTSEAPCCCDGVHVRFILKGFILIMEVLILARRKRMRRPCWPLFAQESRGSFRALSCLRDREDFLIEKFRPFLDMLTVAGLLKVMRCDTCAKGTEVFGLTYMGLPVAGAAYVSPSPRT